MKSNKSCDLLETDTHDLSEMCFEKYGKGYMLYCRKTDEKYMTPYFMEGFWNKIAQGWFFKNEYKDKLIELGAKFIKSEPVDTSNIKMTYTYNDSKY
tara:strand:- start:1285 stop:1575 length:291 start_codon:yes stop_codon:yes gene_type:complete